MSGSEVGYAAVNGSEEVSHPLVGTRRRLALKLVQVALDRKPGKVRPPPADAPCHSIQPSPQGLGQPDGDLGFQGPLLS